jgi:hypothetical protein
MICINIPVCHDGISEQRKNPIRKRVERIKADEVNKEMNDS